MPLVLGATPVFVDVQEETFTLDIADLERRLARVKAEGRLRPRAVVGVDLFGLPADWPAIRAICARARACSRWMMRRRPSGRRCTAAALGGWADATALSFYPTKTLGCYGDGGMILTEDAAKAALYRSLRTHGEGRTRYEVERTGMNGRLDTLAGGHPAAMLPLFAEEIAARRRIARWYRERLSGHPAIGLPAEPAGAEHVYGLFTLRLPDAASRARCRRRCRRRGSRPPSTHPKPLHHQPAYAAAHAASMAGGPPPLPVADALAQRVLSLPMHPYLTDAEVARVAEALIRAL